MNQTTSEATPQSAVTEGTQRVTHYGLFRPQVPASPMIKEAEFFASQGGLTEDWGKSWEPIHDALSVGDARRKIAEKYSVTLSHIYFGER